MISEPSAVRTCALEERLAVWIRHHRRSLLREMVGKVTRPGLLSLAGGLPDPALFPTAEYSEALDRTLRSDPQALQYGMPYGPLKEHIAELMAWRGVECSPDQVVLTSGAQQGIDVFTRLFLESEQRVAFEGLTYTGIQQTVGPFRPRIQALDTDLETGLDVDQLETLIDTEGCPSFLYVVPDAHNPLGVSLSAEKRRRLVQLAAERRFPIVEDDPYGLLAFEQPFEPPLRALDDEWVVYLGSFSKILAPALRLGWMVVPEALAMRATMAKEASDLECSALTQRAVSTLLDELDLVAHLERLRRSYRARRDALLEALERTMPAGARWTHPGGGMFVWVEVSERIDTLALLERTLERNVAFVPGTAFATDRDRGRNGLRLSFSTLEPELIGEAVQILVQCLSEHSTQ